MKILLSPAKNMKDCPDKNKGSIPKFKDETEIILLTMQKLSKKEISEIMKVSDSISELNYNRFKGFLKAKRNPAIFSFNGDVYKGLDIESFDKKELKAAQKKIRILSGMYGILKPLDLIAPYRLEMGTKIKISDKKNLYDFWQEKLTKNLKDSLDKDELVVNLASNEYSKSIKLNEIENNVITPLFKDYKNGKYKIISFYAKKARGLMARYLIKNNIKDLKGLKKFNLEGYKYNRELSTELEPVFTRD